MHFSFVYTREDISSLPVPETQFKGSEVGRLGQLVVTPEVVASKINNLKDNKSPGVDGIYTTIGDACVCVCLHNWTNFCPYALISTPNVP